MFLDYEGHPFWKADVGLFFLFGLIERDAGQWVYRAFWAHDRAEEAQAVVALVDHLRDSARACSRLCTCTTTTTRSEAR